VAEILRPVTIDDKQNGGFGPFARPPVRISSPIGDGGDIDKRTGALHSYRGLQRPVAIGCQQLVGALSDQVWLRSAR